MELSAEICATKQRWDIRDTKENAKDNESTSEKLERMEKDQDQARISKDNKVDFTNVRATSLKFNKRLYLPNTGDRRSESQIQHQKYKTIEAYEEYSKNIIKTPSNLTREEHLGRLEIMGGIRNKQ